MLTDRQAFDQLVLDLRDAIVMRLAGRTAGFDRRFQFLMWLYESDVEAFAEDLRRIKVRLVKSPVHASLIYGQAVHWINDVIGVYRIVACMTIIRKSKSEDHYR